jgi:hypothetical protein
LRDNEVAEIVEMLPGRIYPIDLFKAWDGVFFSEEQCTYLGVWHSNIHNLRSDGQTGLAILGLWYVLCYWLQKANAPDEMPDIPPSELAWRYIRDTERLVCVNNQRNTVRQANFDVTLAHTNADCVFFSPPDRNIAAAADPRVWMWEAWWQGDPYLNIERYYRDTVFGKRTSDDASYDRAIATVIEAAEKFPYIVVQTTASDAGRFERILHPFRQHVEIISPYLDETYVIGKGTP